jgi:hypothetical protein
MMLFSYIMHRTCYTRWDDVVQLYHTQNMLHSVRWCCSAISCTEHVTLGEMMLFSYIIHRTCYTRWDDVVQLYHTQNMLHSVRWCCSAISYTEHVVLGEMMLFSYIIHRTCYTRWDDVVQLYHTQNMLYSVRWCCSAISYTEHVALGEMMMMFALYYTNALSWICIGLAHWKNNKSTGSICSTRILSKPVFARIILCCVLSGEVEITNVLIFYLTRPRLEPMIYRNRDEHDNYYITGAVLFCHVTMT